MEKIFLKTLNWFLYESELMVISKHQLYMKMVEFLDAEELSERDLKSLIRRSEKTLFFRLVESFRHDLIATHYSKKSESLYFSNLIKMSGKEDFIAEKIIQELYPFGYFAYQTSLKLHGISPMGKDDVLMYVIPDRKTWLSLCIDELPTLSNKKLEEKFFNENNKRLWLMSYPNEINILNHKLILFSKKNLSHPIILNGIRVENIFETIMISTQQPQYFGGMKKVISLHNYIVTSSAQLDDYINFVDKNGYLIDKARIGYILNIIYNVKNPIIEKWKEMNSEKRGGSRKLISFLPYSDVYDGSWNISLNFKENG